MENILMYVLVSFLAFSFFSLFLFWIVYKYEFEMREGKASKKEFLKIFKIKKLRLFVIEDILDNILKSFSVSFFIVGIQILFSVNSALAIKILNSIAVIWIIKLIVRFIAKGDKV